MSENNKKEFEVEKVAEILEVVGDKVPKLIRDVMGSLYSKEAGLNMGQAVGAYYKELLAAGLPQEAAVDMAKEFSFSLKNLNFDSGKHN
jgi:hypothetical protein